MSIHKHVQFQIGIVVFLLMRSFLVLADQVGCEGGICKPARNQVEVQRYAGAFGNTEAGAKRTAVLVALFNSCQVGQTESKRTLKCAHPSVCKLFGVAETVPRSCASFVNAYPADEVASWDSVTATDGTYSDFVKQCVGNGAARSECERRWQDGYRYYATATASVPVSAKRPCLTRRKNRCSIQDTDGFAEYFNENSQESSDVESDSTEVLF